MRETDTIATTIADVRLRRDELRGAMVGLEQALASPVPGREEAWAAGVCEAVIGVDSGLKEHVRVTEEAGGLFDQVEADAPRLAHAVGMLRADHRRLMKALAALAALASRRPPDPAGVRADGLRLLRDLAHHRHLGADLVYEAYTVDLGSQD